MRFLWFVGRLHTALWDAGRVWPEDERWLRVVTGLSDTLMGELSAWAEACEALGAGLVRPGARSDLDARADDLVTRISVELRPRFAAVHIRDMGE